MRALGIAGIVGPLTFVALVAVQSILQPDYSQIAMPISALAAWPLGWVQDLSFLLAGVLMILFAIGLHRAVPAGRRGWLALVPLVASGVGILLAGAVPWRRVGTALVEPAGHVVGAVMCFVGVGLGLVAVSRRMTADPRWSGLGRVTLAAGIAVLVLFVLVGGFAIDEGTVLHPWAGLLQRVLLAIWFSCQLVIALRILRLTRAVA